jgi:hypothetical protein
MMVPSKMGWGVAGGVLLLFLGRWKWGPYINPDQQGDIGLYSYRYIGPVLRVTTREIVRILHTTAGLYRTVVLHLLGPPVYCP